MSCGGSANRPDKPWPAPEPFAFGRDVVIEVKQAWAPGDPAAEGLGSPPGSFVGTVKEAAMSAQVDQFCDKLRDRLNAVEGRLRAFETDMEGLPDQAEKSLRDKLETARARLEGQKDRIEQTRAKFKARIHQMMAESQQAVNEWKAKGEARRLIARADWAEAHAVDAIALALAGIDEAEEAILQAVVARMDADAAQATDGAGSGPTPAQGPGRRGSS